MLLQAFPVDNKDVSIRQTTRAAQVVVFLTKNGIANERLQSIGFGETAPIDSNMTAAGRAANRRVEVKLAK